MIPVGSALYHIEPQVDFGYGKYDHVLDVLCGQRYKE